MADGKNGKRINPDIINFPGCCYHCGEKGRTREECDGYRDELAKNNGKRPDRYREKPEIFLDETRKARQQNTDRLSTRSEKQKRSKIMRSPTATGPRMMEHHHLPDDRASTLLFDEQRKLST